jgi:uncharacterized protein (DUF1501 family)
MRIAHDCQTCPWVVPGLHPGWPMWMPRLAFSPPGQAPRGDVLLVVFLRGAADGLNMVVPHGEQAYYSLRPTLAIPRPDERRAVSSLRAIDLDGFFGLHPALAPLATPWQAGHLAIVHACGAPDESRSHFRAMELMERGLTDVHGPASGWISRHLASLDTGNPSPLRAVGIGEQVPRSLRGVVPAAALRSITDFHLAEGAEDAARWGAVLSQLYSGEDPVSGVGRETLRVLETLTALSAQGYRPRPEAAYPDTEFGMGLRQVASLVRAGVGLEAAAIDLGGWDTHFGQGAAEGLMAGLLADLGQGLAALHADLADHLDDLTVVVMTEFGRRAGENASLGTDHGHGTTLFVMGGGANGSRVHGTWPGLQQEELFGPGDLAVTTDYRDVLAEVCRLRLGNSATEAVFPDFTPVERGIVRLRV